jgi:hypothetical protein
MYIVYRLSASFRTKISFVNSAIWIMLFGLL